MSTNNKPTSTSAQQATKLSAEQIALLAKQAGISNEELAKLKIDMSTKELVAYLLEKKQEVDEQIAQKDTDEITQIEDNVEAKEEDKSIFDAEETAENEAEAAQNNTELASSKADGPSETADSGLSSGDELVDASMETIPMSSDYSELLPASGAGQQANSKGFEPWQIGLGVLGVGVGVAALSGGGGGGSHGGSASNGSDTAASTTVSGAVALGMFYDGANVTAIDAEGNVLGRGEVESGQYTLTLKDGYKGVVYLQLVDANGAEYNFNNETTGNSQDLGDVTLMAVDIVANGTNTINITEASSMLYKLAMDKLASSDEENPQVTQEMLDDLSQAFINTLGFDPNSTKPITVDSDAWGQDGVTQAEADYGMFLALLSGVTAQQADGLKGTAELIEGKVSYKIDDDGKPYLQFSDDLKEALYAGALAYDASDNGADDGAESPAQDLADKLFDIDTSSVDGTYLKGVVRGGQNASEINNAVGDIVTFIVSFSGPVSFNEEHFSVATDIQSQVVEFYQLENGQYQYRVDVKLIGNYVEGNVALQLKDNIAYDNSLVFAPDGYPVLNQEFTIDIIKNRSPEDFAELSGPQIAALTNTQIAALTTEQLSAEIDDGSQVITLLTDTKVSLLNEGYLNGLSTELIQGLTAGQVANLTKQQLEINDHNDVKLLAKLTADQISSINTDVLSTLAGTSLASVDDEVFHAFTPDQIEVLTAAQLSSVVSGTYVISKLSTDQVRLLSQDQFEFASTKAEAAIQSMTGDQVNALTLAQLDYVAGTLSSSPTVYERLSDAQKESLPQASVTKFSDDSGSSAGDFDTNVALQTVTGTYSNLGQGRIIEVNAGNDVWVEATLNEDGTWTAELTLLEGDGTQIQIRVKEGEDTLEIEQHEYRLDTTPPDAPVVTTENETINTNTTDASVSFNVTDASVGFVIKISVDGEVVNTHTLTAAEVNAGVYTTTLTGLVEDANLVTATITDTAGNESEPSDTLTVTVDTTAPTIDFNNTSPADEGYVAESGSITIAFNEKIKLGEEGSITLVNMSDSANTQVISIPSDYVTVSEDGLSLIVTPPSSLVKDDQYYVNVSASAVTDMAGNDFAGLTDDTALNFTVSSLNITIGDIAEDNIINAEEAQGTITFALTVSGDSNTLAGLNATDFGLSYEQTVLTSDDFTISKNETIADQWDVTLSESFLAGLADVSSADFGASVTTTVDGSEVYASSAPKSVVVDTTPPAVPTITVDELVNSTSISVTVTSKDAKVGDMIAIGSQADGELVALFITSDNFSETGTYSIAVTLDEGEHTLYPAVIDAAGNVSEMSSPAVVTVDLTAPTLASSSPENEATMASTGNLTFTFNEKMLLAESGSITLVNVADAEDTITIDITDSSQVTLSTDGTTLTVNPTSDLTLGADYEVSIAEGALTDEAGNEFAGTSLSVSVANLSVIIDDVTDDNIINAEEAEDFVTISGKLSGDAELIGNITTDDITITFKTNYPFKPNSYDPATGIWTLNYSDSNQGDTEDMPIKVEVLTDYYGENIEASASSSFAIDTTAPEAGVISSDDFVTSTTVQILGLNTYAVGDEILLRTVQDSEIREEIILVVTQDDIERGNYIFTLTEDDMGDDGSFGLTTNDGLVEFVDATNKVTNDTTPSVTVNLTNTGAQAGDTLTLYREGSIVAGTLLLTQAMIDANAATINALELPGDGDYTFYTTITDEAGNQSSPSSDLVFTLDTTAPTLSTDAISGTTGSVTVNFSEIIRLADATSINLLDEDGNAISQNNVDVTVSGSTLTITSDTIVSGSKYTVALDSGSVTDIVGNALTPIATPEVTIVGAPSLTANQALANINNLDVQSDLVLTYDQDITLLDGTLTLKADSPTGWAINNAGSVGSADSSGDVVLEIVNGVVTAMTVGGTNNQGGTAYDFSNVLRIDGDTLIINLDSTGYDLDFASNYHVEMTSGLIGSTVSDMTSAALSSDNAALTTFTTVSPTDSGSSSVVMNGDATTTASFTWVSAHQGDDETGSVALDFSNGSFAIVQTSTGDAALATLFEGSVDLSNFGEDDLYYFDNFGNTSIKPNSTTELDSDGYPTYEAVFDAPFDRLSGVLNTYGAAGSSNINFIDFDSRFNDGTVYIDSTGAETTDAPFIWQDIADGAFEQFFENNVLTFG